MRVLVLGLVFLSQSVLADRILLTNDDGYQAPGITALYEALVKAGHEVTLVAPATQQSGASASITSSGVKLTQHADNIYSVTGKPADAVMIGISEVFKGTKPDMVISGANFGQNSGRDVMVSGTVGAATIALRYDIPAIAISVEIKFSELEQRFPSTLAAMPGAADFIVRLLNNKSTLPKDGILNVNYPAVSTEKVVGVIATNLADYSLFDGSYRKAQDGTLRPNFNLTPAQERGTDAYELAQGYITLTRLDGNHGLATNRRLKRLAKELDQEAGY